MMRIYTSIAFIILLALTPISVYAQNSNGFSRQGIFGCSRNAAALSGSVGAFSATGGVFVPVADYTVELNTGTLVYQQCVLRGIVNRESESFRAAAIAKTVQTLNTGRDGNPLYARNIRLEDLSEEDRVRLLGLRAVQSGAAGENAQRLVSVLANSYTKDRKPLEQLKCPYSQAQIDQCKNDPFSDKVCVSVRSDTRCNNDALALYFNLDNVLLEQDRQALQAMHDCLNWGRGFYCVTTIDENGDRITETPSAIVEALGAQALTSGFRSIENANDIDQMVGALYAGIGTQVLSGSGGLLTGLTSAIGSGASYLAQMTSESQAGLRNAAANAALQVLAAARAVEAQYNQVITNIANTLTQTISQLRSVENQCWNLIIYNNTAKHVCTAPPTGDTCTSVTGGTLHIATSTQFSQPVIDAQITAIANQVVQNSQKSKQALQTIDQLIQGIMNTNSLDAQRLALVQLDQLVSQGKLHQQSDVTAIQQQQAAVTDTMTQLVEQTKTLWADNTDPTKGWCNVNNQAVIDMWDQKWR